MSELSSAITALQESSSSLNAITNSIASQISTIEDFLNHTCSAGVEASVLIKTHKELVGQSENDECVTTYLAYGRIAAKFRIHVCIERSSMPGSVERKPWAECSRSLKIESAYKLPDLVKEIGDGVRQKVVDAEKAESMVLSVVSSLTLKT